MESKTKLFGHPIHPMLFVLPLAVLATAVVMDVMGLVTASNMWPSISYYIMSVGIVGGAAAAMLGLIDFLSIAPDARGSFIDYLHVAMNFVVVFLFAGSWLLRHDSPSHASAGALLMSLIGTMLSLFTGWFDGVLLNNTDDTAEALRS